MPYPNLHIFSHYPVALPGRAPSARGLPPGAARQTIGTSVVVRLRALFARLRRPRPSADAPIERNGAPMTGQVDRVPYF